MILLDTNVLSEFMRPAPAVEVVSWLDGPPVGDLWISAITRAEIELGLHTGPTTCAITADPKDGRGFR